MAKKMRRPEVVDTDGLSDAHWAQINELLRAFDSGGEKAFWSAAENLEKKHPIDYFIILGSFFPEAVRDALKDGFAAAGVSEEDLRNLQRKLQQKRDDDSGTRH